MVSPKRPWALGVHREILLMVSDATRVSPFMCWSHCVDTHRKIAHNQFEPSGLVA